MANNRYSWKRTLALAGCTAALGAALAFSTGCAGTADVSIVPAGDGATATITCISHQSDRTITVSGTDSVRVEPDIAKVSMQVVIQKDTAEETQAEAARVVGAVQEALSVFGVAGDDIATTNVNMYPRYDYTNGTEQIVGYQMYVYIEVDNLRIEQAGEAIAAATEAGVNSVNGISYYVSDYSAQYAKALEAALNAARAKAAAIAEASGDRLGSVVELVEGYESQQYRYTKSATNGYYAEEPAMAMDMASGVAEAGFGGIQINPGTVKIDASVTVTFELVDVAE